MGQRSIGICTVKQSYLNNMAACTSHHAGTLRKLGVHLIRIYDRQDKVGNLSLAMEIDYGMSSFIARNKLPTLWPNSYLHTQARGN